MGMNNHIRLLKKLKLFISLRKDMDTIVIAALYIIAYIWKKPKCLLRRLIKNIWHISAMEYYSTKRNEIKSTGREIKLRTLWLAKSKHRKVSIVCFLLCAEMKKQNNQL